MKFRTEARPSDINSIRIIVESSGFFHDYEVDTAVELVEEFLESGEESGYKFVFLDDENDSLLAFSCFGEVACTWKRYDIYWIAVKDDQRGKGLGKLILQETEKQIASIGGIIAYLETSSKELYLPTRTFYEKSGYFKEAVIKDFYEDGDSKVIYSKRLGQI
jgi:ribosomal protein S18 acetylase RimI-like enzyme